MKYLAALLLLVSTVCFAQDHQTIIAKYRQGYVNDFLTDANSPLTKADLQYLRFYDADSTYRVTAKAELLANETSFAMPVFAGTAKQYVRFAIIKFKLKDTPMQLTVYRNIALANTAQYASYLFLPFTDGTNGTETYGGGRYIDLNTADFENGEVVIDFNKAYNPYCAFSGRYSCPKPPDENHLLVKIEAGEKQYAGEKKH